MTKHDFHAAWLSHFAIGIPQKKLQKHVLSEGNLLWHVFSHELLDTSAFLEGQAARKAFDKVSKYGALCVDWFEDEPPYELPPELYSAKTLEGHTEVYVVAADFSWTYIKTHESTCGPYFMKHGGANDHL